MGLWDDLWTDQWWLAHGFDGFGAGLVGGTVAWLAVRATIRHERKLSGEGDMRQRISSLLDRTAAADRGTFKRMKEREVRAWLRAFVIQLAETSSLAHQVAPRFSDDLFSAQLAAQVELRDSRRQSRPVNRKHVRLLALEVTNVSIRWLRHGKLYRSARFSAWGVERPVRLRRPWEKVVVRLLMRNVVVPPSARDRLENGRDSGP